MAKTTEDHTNRFEDSKCAVIMASDRINLFDSQELPYSNQSPNIPNPLDDEKVFDAKLVANSNIGFDPKKLFDELEWATKVAAFCANRVWAVGGRDLSKLLPPEGCREKIVANMKGSKEAHLNGNSHALLKCQEQKPDILSEATMDSNNHQMCTFDFCEQSVRDYTGVIQRHECANQECKRLRYLIPRNTLTKAAAHNQSTVWNSDGCSMLNRSHPYMAIRHVWSDGTGAGQWPDGEVNGCLHRYFKSIAMRFRCGGIWWDTVCTPTKSISWKSH